jgi:hypothetical protein
MSGDLLNRLAAAGTPMDLIMEVAETLAEARAAERLLERRREKDRLRKRHSAESVESAEALEIAESAETPSPQSPPLKSTPDPVKITPPLTPQPIDSRARATPLFPPPTGVEAGQWRAFRQQRKKALTDRAYLMICNKLTALAEAGWPPGEMIDLAIERGWETVFEPKDQGNGTANRTNGRMGGPRPDPTLELLRAARAAQRPVDRDHDQARLALPAR